MSENRCAAGNRLPKNGGPCPTCGATSREACGRYASKLEDQKAELLRALKMLVNNINEFGAVTDREFIDSAMAAIAKAEAA